jgi:hypothetical protein
MPYKIVTPYNAVQFYTTLCAGYVFLSVMLYLISELHKDFERSTDT